MPFFLFVFLASSVFAQVGTLTVTVLSSEAGTGLTEIEYTFTGDGDVYTISATVSFDNGNSFDPIPAADLAGTLINVAPGGPYSLTWNGRASFPGTFSTETIIRLGAISATFTCGDDLTFTYRGLSGTYGTVLIDYSSKTSLRDIGTRCWLDRNLGANPMPFVPADDATGNTDTRLYGDLFQWGRLDDGHQDRTSITTSQLSPTDDPGHSKFITAGSSSNYDWRSPQNNALWQGDAGINNPCPPGWRLPTKSELDAECQSWGPGNDNSTGAYASVLKWPVGGTRNYTGAPSTDVGTAGTVWSSSVGGTTGTLASHLYFRSSSAGTSDNNRAIGMSVRCVREF